MEGEDSFKVPNLKACYGRLSDYDLTRDVTILKEWKRVDPFFGEPYLRVERMEGGRVLKDDVPWKTYYEKDGETTHKLSVDADICYDCIRQLAKLIPQEEPKNAGNKKK